MLAGVGLIGLKEGWDQEKIEDRVYRLRHNAGQIRTDKFAARGALGRSILPSLSGESCNCNSSISLDDFWTRGKQFGGKGQGNMCDEGKNVPSRHVHVLALCSWHYVLQLKSLTARGHILQQYFWASHIVIKILLLIDCQPLHKSDAKLLFGQLVAVALQEARSADLSIIIHAVFCL